MNAQPIVIVGTGGAGRETLALLLDVVASQPESWDFQGFLGLDPPDYEGLERLGAPFLGSPRDLTSARPEAGSWSYALGIGNPQHRRHMDTCLTHQGLSPATLIHPTALIGPDVEIAPGAVICANTVITTNVRIGLSVQVNIGCIIGHDARIGDYVTFAQRVSVAGNVTIEDDATLFTNCSLIPGVTVGHEATVGSGAVVTHNVHEGVTVVGIPAKPLA